MRSRNLAALLSIGLFAACAQDGVAGNTEIQLTIGNGLGAQSGQAAFEADRVDYRITCAGTAPGSAPIPPSGAGGDYAYNDSVDVSGAFEIVDARNPLIWQAITDLPPGPCTASLSVYRGGQVACLGSHPFTVLETSTTMVDITLLCELSIGVPDGTGDTEGQFQFEIGNECPRLFDLTAHPYAIPVSATSTLVQVVAQDPDGTCGNNCDPQTCTDANPPVCTPGPDPGLTTTLSAAVGSFDDPSGALTTYHCDPAFPGPIEICVVASDGDLDCDKTACIAVDCPDLCEGVVCNDGNECTADSCDPASGLCVFDNAPDGIACDSCNSTCQAGMCDPLAPFTADQNASTMFFTGSLQSYTTNLVNPYSGQSVPVSGTYNINVSSYKGVGASDQLVGTNFADVLFVQDPVGTQRICGVEYIVAQNNLDVLFLADKFIHLESMTLSGGNADDILWGNSGMDVIQGNNGNDIIDGGPGDDAITGDNGNDLITWWPGAGFDGIWGGNNYDTVMVKALLSQLEITPALNPGFELDVYYLGNRVMQLLEVELLVALNGTIDLTACTAGVCNLCGNDDLNGGEQCDDGNLTNGDGCASDCTLE